MLSIDEVGRMAAMNIWTQLCELVARSEIVIDRPRGRPHPKVPEYVYPLDYGYLTETSGGDGEGIDIWVGSDGEETGCTALICTCDLVKKDAELKIAWRCTPREIDQIQAFYAPQPQSVLIIRRADAP